MILYDGLKGCDKWGIRNNVPKGIKLCHSRGEPRYDCWISFGRLNSSLDLSWEKINGISSPKNWPSSSLLLWGLTLQVKGHRCWLTVSPGYLPFLACQDFCPFSYYSTLGPYICLFSCWQPVICLTRLAKSRNALLLHSATEQRLERMSWITVCEWAQQWCL